MNKTTKIEPSSSARLFADMDAPGASAGVYLANIDGASRGNPGPASYAVVIRDPNGKVVLELGKKIGRATNNVAEYYALLAALDYAVNENISALRIQSDSELLVRQMQGRYKVKSPELKPLFERAAKISRQIRYFKIEHVRRELNRDADGLANVALDSGDTMSAAAASPSRPVAAGSALIKKLEPAEKPAKAESVESAEKLPEAYRPIQLSPPIRHTIRARFVSGVLVPAAPLELPEGAEVVAEIRTVSEE